MERCILIINYCKMIRLPTEIFIDIINIAVMRLLNCNTANSVPPFIGEVWLATPHLFSYLRNCDLLLRARAQRVCANNITAIAQLEHFVLYALYVAKAK